MNESAALHAGCHYFHFGLIVTGEGEAQHLSKLFRTLMATGMCSFHVIRQIGQRSPVTSAKRKLQMVGTGKTLFGKDDEEIGIPARQFLNISPCHYVVLIDDLEHDRRSISREVYNRYRSVFDTLLNEEYQKRVSVHFLVNMLEAYYFADSDTVNLVLDLDPEMPDYDGDVETINHPKNDLKMRYPGFDEIQHGGLILRDLDVAKILSNPQTCASLRTLFAWCVQVLAAHPQYAHFDISTKFCLKDGVKSGVTGVQLQ